MDRFPRPDRGRAGRRVPSRRFWLLPLLVACLAASAGEGAASGAARRAAASFDPLSATFVSPNRGWVLGLASCPVSLPCLQLRETRSAGRSWTVRSLPAALASAADRRVGGRVAALYGGPGLEVRFADARDGWIYGDLPVAGSSGVVEEPELWATHDGGRGWGREQPPWIGRQGSILDLEAAAGRVHLMTIDDDERVTVASSPASSDRWHVSSRAAFRLPAGGAEVSGAFVLEGSSGWLVEGNDRGTTGSARLLGGRWLAWTPPCASVGGSFAIPAASTPTDLVAACVMGGFASPLSKAAPRGATIGSTWLYLSDNGGRSFEAGPEIGRRGTLFDGVLASPSPEVILIGRQDGAGQELRASFDGGKRWRTVYRGSLDYLGFTTPSRGVGIVESPGGVNTMIMSFDGGRRWAPVRF